MRAKSGSGNDDLSSRTEQQAASLEETAASMEQLTATVKQNAEKCPSGRHNLALARPNRARRGGKVVDNVVQSHPRHRGQCAENRWCYRAAIDGIAFQPDLWR
ncbi:hypothetical protein ACNKHO_27645 [Shigella flexneri]